MKKISVFLLALLYIITSSGVMINTHYCMGKLVDRTFLHYEDQNCSYCGMKEIGNKGCCENKQKFLKINKDQKTADANYRLSLFTSFELSYAFFEIPSIDVPSSLKEHLFSSSSPRGQNLPLFIRNCVFRI